MQFIFIITAVYGGFFFLVQRRPFDFVSMGFIGALVYFMPAFSGYVTNPYYPWLLPSIPIVESTYIVWIAALLGTILAGHIYRPGPQARPLEVNTDHVTDWSIIFVIVGSFSLALLTGGSAVWSSDKHEVLENINRFFLLFGAASQLGFVAFVLQRKLVKALIPGAGIAFLLFVGFRTDLALAMIAIGTYLAGRRGLFSLVRARYIIPVSSVILLLFTYKPLLYAWRAGRVDLAAQYLSEDELLAGAILRSEPFITQSILNEILSRDFSMDPTAIIYSILAVVPFLVPATGVEVSQITFNFQDQIFPNLSYGAGSNIYAHFFATLGYGGITLFILVHNLSLIAVSQAVRKQRSPYKMVLLLSVGAFLAFYIHRNDVVNSLSIINRSLLTGFVFFILATILRGGGALRGDSASRVGESLRR